MSGSIGQFTKASNPRRKESEGRQDCAATTTQIVPARSTRTAVVITNLDVGTSVFVGESPVTTAEGYELQAGKSITLDSKKQIDGITASGTVTVTFAESHL